jgi:hypothetical protein
MYINKLFKDGKYICDYYNLTYTLDEYAIYIKYEHHNSNRLFLIKELNLKDRSTKLGMISNLYYCFEGKLE